ncbi:MAG: type 4a pilus biogenesis protein PilO [Phycisphaerae bacterium]|nr:type 4a pilus biogenesis protein PilO [Phycisphaerae bacterium]
MNSGMKKLLFFIVILGISYVAYQYMLKPANKNLSENKKRVEAKYEKLAELERATSAANDLHKQLGELEEAIKFFESKLPSTSEIHKVLEQVTVIAQKQGLKPKTIKTLEKKNNSGYIEQPLKMELQGNFNSFYSFLLELEKLPRIMKIRNLELQKVRDAQGEVSTNFIVSIFFQNNKG